MAVGLAACATAGTEAPEEVTDARPQSDARPGSDASDNVPDATLPDAALPDAGCTDMQLLANPDFDAGPGGGWIEQASEALIKPDGQLSSKTPHSGGYAVWLGGLNNANESLRQTVTIPQGTVALELSGYRWITTNENNTTPFDFVYIVLFTPQGQRLEELAAWNNQDSGTAWSSFSYAATMPYAGQSVNLEFQVTTDGTYTSSFFMDTLALRATVCP